MITTIVMIAQNAPPFDTSKTGTLPGVSKRSRCINVSSLKCVNPNHEFRTTYFRSIIKAPLLLCEESNFPRLSISSIQLASVSVAIHGLVDFLKDICKNNSTCLSVKTQETSTKSNVRDFTSLQDSTRQNCTLRSKKSMTLNVDPVWLCLVRERHELLPSDIRVAASVLSVSALHVPGLLIPPG